MIEEILLILIVVLFYIEVIAIENKIKKLKKANSANYTALNEIIDRKIHNLKENEIKELKIKFVMLETKIEFPEGSV